MAEEVPQNVPVSGLPTKKGFPRTFGRYILEKNLSRGGMGEVFLAVVKGVGARCVIKTIRGDLTGDKEFVGRFADEAKIMVRMGHPNIIRVFDCGKVGTDYYIAMEYVHGRDLGDVLDRAYERGEPLPRELGLFIAKQLLSGLDYAHNLTDERGRLMKLVHRDISPQNVLIGFDGAIKLIDFGLARTELLPGRTQGALAVGKYGYMSPEQARHERIDGRADLYSAGVMLFEVFTGDRLVDEQDQATLWARILSPKHRKPSTVIPNMPADIDELIMTAVSVKPEDRFASASAMVRFIEQMRSRSGARDDLIGHLRHLYPTVDFNAPPIPDYSGQVDEGEKSMVFAVSEEAAKSVFGRGELPVEWTMQIKADELAALRGERDREREREQREREREAARDREREREREREAARERERDRQRDREREREHDKTKGTDDGQNTGPMLVGGDVIAELGLGGAVLPDSPADDAPTTIAHAESGLPIDALADHDPTRYERAPRSSRSDATQDSGAEAGFSTRLFADRAAPPMRDNFRDDEATVMMTAPPRPGAWAGEDMTNEDVYAPTKMGGNATQPPSTVPSVTGGPTPSLPPPGRNRAIQERNVQERTEPKITRGRVPQRNEQPKDTVTRTRPERPAENEPQQVGPAPGTPANNNLMLLGLIFMGITIIILLLVLIYLT